MAAFREEATAEEGFMSEMPIVSSSMAHSRVELHLSASKIKKMDTFSRSDPFCVVYIGGKEVGRTEVIQNTQEPHWATSIIVEYFFEEAQDVTIVMYDEDKPNAKSLNAHDLQGQATFRLGTLMTDSDQKLTLSLVHPKKPGTSGLGTVTVVAEEAASSSEFLQLRLRGKKLVNKDGLFGRSDPFFMILRSREDGSWIPVYRSMHVMNNLSPIWPTAKKIPIQALCNGDYDRPLRLEVWDWEKDGKHDAMGYAETSVRSLLSKAPLAIREVKKGKTKAAGTVEVMEAGILKFNTFADYLSDGWELNMVIAIDFTGSNGNPVDPSSLHYVDPTGSRLNQYQRTIVGLTDVLSQYDKDQLFPVFGFGGREAGARTVSHCFPLNKDPANPYVHGVQGVLEAYKYGLTQFGLSGPTVFSQIVQATANLSRSHEANNEKVYSILLIITDGAITDLDATKAAIVEASDLPLSIIIVGVGSEDFSSMVELDSDDQRLTDAAGRIARRDIVQFVSFQEFANAAPGRLAKETLVELPSQMIGYFQSKQVELSPRGDSSQGPAAAEMPRASGSGSVPLDQVGKKLLRASLGE